MTTRREFLKRSLRIGAFSSLVLLGVQLGRRDKTSATSCELTLPCRNCKKIPDVIYQRQYCTGLRSRIKKNRQRLIMKEDKSKSLIKRRDFIKSGASTFAGLAVSGVAGLAIFRTSREEMVWQIDPNVCVQCERCSVNCVLPLSAVKCVHSYSMCGYCDLCSGYLQPGAKLRNTAAENRLCPTGAIKRTYVEERYFEYTIDESLCIACGKCVKGCVAFGNGSLQLQIRHDRCKNCNECSIGRSCPSQAIRRVPASRPYLMRGDEGNIFILRNETESDNT